MLLSSEMVPLLLFLVTFKEPMLLLLPKNSSLLLADVEAGDEELEVFSIPVVISDAESADVEDDSLRLRAIFVINTLFIVDVSFYLMQ